MFQEEEKTTFVYHEQPKSKSFINSIWNSEKKEFLGRNFTNWAKLGLFYLVFYICLSGSFFGMFSVFSYFLPLDRPTYYGKSGTISLKGFNPGLGFRPQIDIEDNLIKYSPNDNNSYKPYVENLKKFLKEKYVPIPDDEKLSILNKTENIQNYSDEHRRKKFYEFDYKEIFSNTECTEEKNFGYGSSSPCVLIKVNKLFSWYPHGDQNTTMMFKCEGETAVDQDNLLETIYHSENNLKNQANAFIEKKYFPYEGQKYYRVPFFWVEFKVRPNVLINIICRSLVDTLKYDRLTGTGLTKFSLFIKS